MWHASLARSGRVTALIAGRQRRHRIERPVKLTVDGLQVLERVRPVFGRTTRFGQRAQRRPVAQTFKSKWVIQEGWEGETTASDQTDASKWACRACLSALHTRHSTYSI